MTITMLVLIALVGCVVYARRRGWLPGSGTGLRPTSGAAIDIRATRRVSMSTTLHVVRYEGADYLLVETVRGATTLVTPLSGSPDAEGAKP